MRRANALVFLAAAMVLGTSGPADAQYIFLDANADSANSSADILSAEGTTTLEVWLSTNHNRDTTEPA